MKMTKIQISVLNKMAVVLVLLNCFLFTVAEAKNLSTVASSGEVVFKAKALGLKFEGKGTGPSGELTLTDSVQGMVTFSMDTLDTGIGLRNTHMKDNYLETKKFPEAKLTIIKVVGFTEASADGEYPFEGQLTVRGIEKPITNGKVNVKKVDMEYVITAQFDTKISNYEIALPKYSGVVVKDEVQVVTKAKFKEMKTK